MITELKNFIETVSKQFPLEEFVKPENGLHLMHEVNDGQVKLYNAEIYQPSKGKENEYSDFIREECLPRLLHMHYINSNKSISDKKIHSASPYGFMLKKQSIEDKKWMISWKENIQKYFQESENKCMIELTEDENNILEIFKRYCSEKVITEVKNLKDYEKLKKGDYLIVYLKNLEPEKYEKANQTYLENNIFNTPEFTTKEKIGNELYGASDYYNGFNLKKPYLHHKSAPFNINFRIPQSVARWLFVFNQYMYEGAFKTNPLVVFIDKEELNNEVVSVIKRENNKISFHQLMHTLFERKGEDLGNYYLFYFLGGDIKDVDFVSSFSFKLEVKIKKVIPSADLEEDEKIENIFQFELEILQIIFNNQLIQKRRDDSIAFRYFDDIDHNPKYITDTEWQLVMRYRKSFYDFIYKSRRQAVTNHVFHDIIRQGIFNDLKNDEIQNDQHTKTYSIRRKLNLWFSLWDFFKGNSTKNNLTMANKITDHQERLRTVRDNPTEHIQTDDEFAFVAGQVIHYLLTKSKSANLTHASLEPFLQKTDAGELKKAIANTFNAYKHEIEFRQGRFEKFCSEVMDYELIGNLKQLLPYLLAGYFSTSLIYEKSQTK